MPTVTVGGNSTNTFSGATCTRMKEGSPTTNWFNDRLEITKYGASNWTTSVLSFSGLSSLPANAVVTATSFFLYLDATAASGASGTYVIAAKRLLRNWVGSQATWNVYSTGNNWTTGGAFGNATDRNNVVAFESGGLNLSAGYKEFVGNSTGIAEVQDFITGAVSNYGWMLERTDGVNDGAYRYFYDADDTDGQRPYLSVTYEFPKPAQSKFRWRKDNGTETTATWASSENNNVVAPLG